MKKLPTFTLVRRVIAELDQFVMPTASKAGKLVSKASQNSKSSAAKPKQTKLSSIKSSTSTQRADQMIRQSITAPSLLEVFSKLEPNFKRALTSSFVKSVAKKSEEKLLPLAIDSVKSITKDLARHKKVLRVGVLDMGNWIGELPMLLDRLNASQPLFTIFEVQAAIPGGLIKTPEGVSEWAAGHLNRSLKKAERAGLEQQMIANDYFIAAEDIRKSIGIDLIVGMTPAMVAGVSHDGGVYWNHISSVSGKTILISTADMRQWAEKAGRPFEAAIGASLVTTLLIAINNKLRYHKDTGCLFDFKGSRISFADTLKALQIEDSCLAKMTQEQKETALAMLSVLRRMKRRAK